MAEDEEGMHEDVYQRPSTNPVATPDVYQTPDDLEPVEYEDEDDEPEELKVQKTCEAPTERQRREHITEVGVTFA